MRSAGTATPRREITGAALILVLGVGRVCFILWSSVNANGGPGFPLDDPWIHLQFARTLREFGAFSYFRTEMVTAGSTSPLYTLLLALGFVFTSHEMALSYFLGITFLAVAGAFFVLLLRRLTPGMPLFALAGLLGFVMEPRLCWAAISGMETTLFIACVLASLYFFAAGRWRLLALSMGGLIWIRPEGVLLVALLTGGTVYRMYFEASPEADPPRGSNPGSPWIRLRVPLALFLLIASGYFSMNLALSGSLFPNSYAAKVNYDISGRPAFPAQVFAYFTGGHMSVIALLAVVGAVVAVRDFLRLRRSEPFLILCWIVLLILVYWRELPFMYQEGRYVMPAIGPFMLLGLVGAAAAPEFLRRRFFPRSDGRWISRAPIALALIPVVQSFSPGETPDGKYAEACRYIRDRQVKTACWLHDNLPGNAVVATHDIGAIGFYSELRVVDIVGLISPEVIPGRHNVDSLRAFLVRRHVTHLAVLRSWCEVVNVDPVFMTDESRPAVMEVFPFDTSRIHFIAGNVFQLEQLGLSALAGGDPSSAAALFKVAIRLDGRSSRLHMNLGLSLLAAGKVEDAEVSLQKALEIHPTLWRGRVALASAEKARGHAEAAITRLQAILHDNPDVGEAYELLADLYTSSRHDTASARMYREEARTHGGEGGE
jgi:hypothetical protein